MLASLSSFSRNETLAALLLETLDSSQQDIEHSLW